MENKHWWEGNRYGAGIAGMLYRFVLVQCGPSPRRPCWWIMKQSGPQAVVLLLQTMLSKWVVMGWDEVAGDFAAGLQCGWNQNRSSRREPGSKPSALCLLSPRFVFWVFYFPLFPSASELLCPRRVTPGKPTIGWSCSSHAFRSTWLFQQNSSSSNKTLSIFMLKALLQQQTPPFWGAALLHLCWVD